MFFYVTLQAFGRRPWRRPEDDRQPVKVWSTLLLEERGKRNGVAWLGLLIAHRWYFQDQTSQSLGNILICNFGFKYILRTKGHDRVPVGGVVFLRKADFSLSLMLAKG